MKWFNFCLGVMAVVAISLSGKPVVEMPLCHGEECWQNQPPQPITKNLDDIAAAIGDHVCYAPEDLPSGAIATWVVATRVSDGKYIGLPFDEAWKQANGGKIWVVSLCLGKEG